MKKLIKRFAIFLFLFSFVGSSYASIVSSDGSSFVTKDEFNIQITDFNTRLTTFEAGINSKIDSQVTSYLDRNGIWSGRTQIEFEGTDLCLSKTPDVSFTVQRITTTGNQSGSSCIMCQYVGQIDKSGLCYIILNDYNDSRTTVTVNQKRLRVDNTAATGNWVSDNSLSLKYRFVKLPIPGGDANLNYHYNKKEPNYTYFDTVNGENKFNDGFRYYDEAGYQKGNYTWEDARVTSLYEIVPYPAQTQYYDAYYMSSGGDKTISSCWVQFNVTAYNTMYFFVSKKDYIGFLAYYQYSLYSGYTAANNRDFIMQSMLGTKIDKCLVY